MYGFRDDGHAHCEGLNSRLDELQAAILRVKLGPPGGGDGGTASERTPLRCGPGRQRVRPPGHHTGDDPRLPPVRRAGRRPQDGLPAAGRGRRRLRHPLSRTGPLHDGVSLSPGAGGDAPGERTGLPRRALPSAVSGARVRVGRSRGSRAWRQKRFLTQMYARFSSRQVGQRRGKTLRMCSCPVRSGAVVCRSIDGRLRGPRSWWGACSAAAGSDASC